MSCSKWRRSPSRDKCSRRFCGSSRNYGRSHHPRQHEAFDCHAFKSNRQEECVQMSVKIARSAPRPSFGLPELLVGACACRLWRGSTPFCRASASPHVLKCDIDDAAAAALLDHLLGCDLRAEERALEVDR